MAARASRASSGRASKTLRPEPAWIAMMPMLCATMSCSSRAIRSRSAIAVWAAAWARTSSARACACRIECPISQAMIVTRGTAIVTTGIAAIPTLPPRSASPERALPGAESAGRRRPWRRQSPRLCGCVSPLCSRSQGPLRRRPRPAGRSPASRLQHHAGHRSAKHHGQRRERPAAQQESGNQQGAAKHRESPHDHLGASSLPGHAHGSDRSRLAVPVVCPRAYARRATAAPCRWARGQMRRAPGLRHLRPHERDYRD